MVLSRLSACLFRTDKQKTSGQALQLYWLHAISQCQPFTLHFPFMLIVSYFVSLFLLVHFLLHLFFIFLSMPACQGPESSMLETTWFKSRNNRNISSCLCLNARYIFFFVFVLAPPPPPLSMSLSLCLCSNAKACNGPASIYRTAGSLCGGW